MAIEIKIPSLGESISEGTLSRWLRRKGEFVREMEPLFELETDKDTSEVPSPASGQLLIQVNEGETVGIGAVVGEIDETAEEKNQDEKKSAPSGRQETPLVQKPPSEKPKKTAKDGRPTTEVPQGIDNQAVAASPRQTVEPQEDGSRESRQPMSRIRRTIAERLIHAQQSAAILTTFNEADMSQVIAIRGRFKEHFQQRFGVSLGFMSFFVKASVEALKAFPMVNSRIDGSDIVQQNFYDIGVAVSTDRGLMVPVIRRTEQLSFAELESAVTEYGQKAREGRIVVEDLQGGTFTITNGGVFGSLLSTPILNPPQSAILGMHTIQKRPVVVDDQIVVRPMMYLALSYDHRLIDGREAVQFLGRIKEVIERPERLLLGV